MTEKPTPSIIHHFSSIEDPRLDRQKNISYRIYSLSPCAPLFVVRTTGWLLKRLAKPSLVNRIPAHDTFGDVFAAIDRKQFSECFTNWVSDLANLTEGEVIAIDGKCLRRSIDRASKKSAIHMVSAVGTL